MAKVSKILCWIFIVHFCMCHARKGVLDWYNTNRQREAKRTLKQLRKVIGCLSEIQDMPSKADIRALENTILELQSENDEMKAQLNRLQAACTCETSSTSPETISTTTETSSTTTTVTTMTTTTVATCDEGWTHHGGNCYHFTGEKKNWAGASLSCWNRGAFLTEITTDAEYNFFYTFVRPYYRYTKFFWLGATDRGHEGTFVYEHSKLEVPKKYWKYEYVEDVEGVEHCVYMSRMNRKLYHEGCFWKFYVVCQKPAALSEQ